MADYKITVEDFIDTILKMHKNKTSAEEMVSYVRKNSKRLTLKNINKEEKEKFSGE